MQHINYGAKVQLTAPADTSAPLTDSQKLKLQQVSDSLLYYTRAVDATMLIALSTLVSAQAKGTAATAEAMNQLLEYCATHPNAEVRIIHQTWSYKSAATPLICQNQSRAAAPEAFLSGQH
jgi:hypothetical protein